MIYLLIESGGAYDDYREYPLAYFMDKKEAEEKVREFNSKLDELQDKNSKLEYYDTSIRESHGFNIQEVELYTPTQYPTILSDEYWESIVDWDKKWSEDD